jgi:hypothetical protein
MDYITSIYGFTQDPPQRRVVQQRQVSHALATLHPTRDDELPPEPFFRPLSCRFIGAVDVRHLMPDDGGQRVVEDSWPFQRSLKGAALPNQEDDPTSLIDVRLYVRLAFVQASRVRPFDHYDLLRLSGQQPKRSPDGLIVGAGVGFDGRKSEESCRDE